MAQLIGSGRNSIKFLQMIQPSILAAPTGMAQEFFQTQQQVRHRQTKHWNPKFKRLRQLKFVKIDLPNFQEKVEDLSKEEMRSRMKKRGILPPRPWMERPFHISCTGGIFEPYVPPEGDGKKSFISTTGAKQKFEMLEKKSKSMLAVRKIKAYEEEFSTDEFAMQAQDIYNSAHTHMADKNKLKLREFITERCYPEMQHNVRDKTIHWSFLQSLEPPRIVHARVTDVISKENLFAQVTVRFHTQQKLAIYDRFGRLMYGSEIIPKDVLEYVVFEKQISNEYGQWRLHDKIIPDWLPPREPTMMTYRLIEEEEEIVEQIAAPATGQEPKQLEEGAKQLAGGDQTTQVVIAKAAESAKTPNTSI